MKRLAVAVFLLALALSGGALAGCGGDLSADAVAKVGDVEIAENVFNQRLEEFGAQYGYSEETTDPETWRLFKLDVLEYLVTYEMAAQKAGDYGVEVTDEDVQTEIDTIIESYYGGDEEAFNEDLASSDITLDQLKANYKESMLMQKVYEQVTAAVSEPTDEEIAAYYEQNKDDYYIEETRTARHILIAPDGEETNETTSTTGSNESSTTTTELTDADWADALATAEKVRDLLRAGGDWAQLAAEYSDDSGTADSGGELGVVEKGEMIQEFEDALFSLELNEISQPVKTAFGYHIIQVTTIDEARQETLEEVTEDIRSTLLSQKQKAAWTQWIAESKTELNVIYREDMQTTTTVPTESTDTTLSGKSTTTAGQTITTGADTTTTAKP
ncbi:MAG: peptidylprolyl isomerase [Actinomycetia bacterium]|nr:peptidylprolyl isomerase [Actinomycetes bacterium]